ncbi:MAG: crossover junction endodeoxyribonuclease RuvC [Fimbriimonadaceae bacterium]|jgi:crossover junction endodeoxyribonuclease RuvC|nr:crossover junction endodeoxyribonuclease RuvC [Fimbriimonadaceae bacterium]
MRILGIDPGLEKIGYGLIDKQGSQLKVVEYGLIQTPRIPLPERLRLAHDQMLVLVDAHKPDAVATERLFFTVNKTTAMDVAKALGVLLLACSERGLEWAEYSPPEVKLAVVGNGNAEKRQVQFMVQKLLGLESAPKPDDVADALAIAITHALRSSITALRK